MNDVLEWLDNARTYIERINSELSAALALTKKLGEQNSELCDEKFELKRRVKELEAELANLKKERAA